MDYTNDSKNSFTKPDNAFIDLKHFEFNDTDNKQDSIINVSSKHFKSDDDTGKFSFKESKDEYDICFVPLETINFDTTSNSTNDFDVSLDNFKFEKETEPTHCQEPETNQKIYIIPLNKLNFDDPPDITNMLNVSSDISNLEDKDDISDFLNEIISSEVRHGNKKSLTKKVKKEKKNSKKRKKQKKQNQLRLNQELSMFYAENDFNSGAFIARLVKDTDHFIVKDKQLYIYNEDSGQYEMCQEDDFSIKLNSLLNEDISMKVKTSEYKDAYNQMCMSHELITDKGFFENGPFVNCLNGVVDVINRCLLPHSPKYRFKHCIQANYVPGKDCPKYLGYIDTVTGSNKELIALAKGIHGYMFSHYNNAKIAILVIAESHTGKSVMCNIMERIIGSDNVAHADLALLHKQEYAAHLSGKLANIVPDLKNVPLKDVGFFKSLVSHNDTIAARALYHNPGNVRGETKMLFSSNHHIQFEEKNIDEGDVIAVFNRLLYFPFQNKPITEKKENKNFSEEIYEERDAIFTWAMEGLREYILNNEIFPKSKLSEQKKNENYSMYCPEKVFFDNCIKEKNGAFESVTSIKVAFSEFCSHYKIKTKTNITSYIEKQLGITATRKRVDKDGNIRNKGNPIYVYPNIKLRQ